MLLQNGSKSAKRKPTVDDTISTKSSYIMLKHQKFQYAFRQNKEDGLLCVENELGKQLHASVRTNKLDVSFRLLTQGADPNYFHDVSQYCYYILIYLLKKKFFFLGERYNSIT